MKALRLTLWLAGIGCGAALPAFAGPTGAPVQTGAERRRAAEQELLVQLHYNDLQEIALGRLGAERGQTPAVRKLGARIARDYARFDATLARIAQRRGVDLDRAPPRWPDPGVVRARQELPTLEGQSFDRDFLQAVIADETIVISTTAQDARPAQVTGLQVAMARTVPAHRDTAVDLLRGRQWKEGVPTIPPPFKISPQ